MSIETRLKKLEQYLKPNGKKTDMSHLTENELDFLLNAYENDRLNDPEVQRLLNTIDFKEDLSYMTDLELEAEINRLQA